MLNAGRFKCGGQGLTNPAKPGPVRQMLTKNMPYILNTERRAYLVLKKLYRPYCAVFFSPFFGIAVAAGFQKSGSAFTHASGG